MVLDEKSDSLPCLMHMCDLKRAFIDFPPSRVATCSEGNVIKAISYHILIQETGDSNMLYRRRVLIAGDHYEGLEPCQSGCSSKRKRLPGVFISSALSGGCFSIVNEDAPELRALHLIIRKCPG
ncbi:hypothetical protein KOW79_013963 [Hemibagrus wyckioides]|uniref:Uncharacterized protein n=1 Tax=Hemibagrus wyckioides TaxID=337641 RepID=A0A9D3NHW9_9TELE|nr:hypothetical protein KOW79_013963 [Hemibagrus wyckioides]